MLGFSVTSIPSWNQLGVPGTYCWNINRLKFPDCMFSPFVYLHALSNYSTILFTEFSIRASLVFFKIKRQVKNLFCFLLKKVEGFQKSNTALYPKHFPFGCLYMVFSIKYRWFCLYGCVCSCLSTFPWKGFLWNVLEIWK